MMLCGACVTADEDALCAPQRLSRVDLTCCRCISSAAFRVYKLGEPRLGAPLADFSLKGSKRQFASWLQSLPGTPEPQGQ